MDPRHLAKVLAVNVHHRIVRVRGGMPLGSASCLPIGAPTPNCVSQEYDAH
jgi:hypothetical protein